MRKAQPVPSTGAQSVLLALKANGVDYLFANAGTDFPPIIEALASLDPDLLPQAVTVPHETASMAMAHGYYLVTGQAQAVMVHVNVGLANAVMGVINAASDNIPVMVMSGRTPITEFGRLGSRATPIQYGQEMYDQTSLVRDVVKFTYEMRYPEQGAALVGRALTLAKSEPQGPVYLSLPREPLDELIPEAGSAWPAVQKPASGAQPDAGLIDDLAKRLATAKAPVILCQRSDPQGHMAKALSSLAARHAIGVVEPFSVRNVLRFDDPSLLGYDATRALQEADVIVVVDCDIPWIALNQTPNSQAYVAHIGPDPHFQRMPVRGYQTDMALTSDPFAAVVALDNALNNIAPETSVRRATLVQKSAMRVNLMSQKAEIPEAVITAEWMSKCVADIMDDRAVAFTELGLLPQFMTLAGANRLFSNVHAGGLGWAMPAALGAQLADRDRLVIAAMGDGSYMFANPVACHQIAEALGLPILTIIKNNGMWNAVRRSVVRGYPQGAAAKANVMPLTSLEPAPDFTMIAAASRAYVERCEKPADLPAALARAVAVIRNEKRQVLLDLRVAVSDIF
mgnify:CR=1 FL=1